MLEVLRSLTPPREPPKAEGTPEEPGRSWPHGEDEKAPSASAASADEEAPQIAPSGPAPDGRIIRLRVEEAGLFFLAGVVLVVMAFLMGWYGRGTGTARPALDSRRDVFSGAAREPASAMDSSPGRDLGTRPGRVRRAPARSGGGHSILVARFPPGGAGDAEDHRLSLNQRGYPAWMRSTAEGIELCVGTFDSRADGLARQWLPKLRKLSPAYSSARIVKLP